MMITSIKFPAILFSTLLLWGCGKTSIDNTDPEIEVFQINGAEQIESHTVGSPLNIELYITDNEELQEVLIKIENISNGTLSQSQKLLHFQVFGDVDSKTFSELIGVPTDEDHIAGRYNIQLQVVDANGNVDTDSKEFVLLNPGPQPTVEIDSYAPPLQDGLITIQRGDSLVVNGWMVDENGLAKLVLSLNGPQNLHFEEVFIQEPDFTGYSFDWVARPMVPVDAATGDYSFDVELTDVDGHMTFFYQPVKIVE